MTFSLTDKEIAEFDEGFEKFRVAVGRFGIAAAEAQKALVEFGKAIPEELAGVLEEELQRRRSWMRWRRGGRRA